MNSEIVNIEMTQKIARLEKENRQYEKIITSFDLEVNRLFRNIKEIYEYVDRRLLCVEEKQKEKLLIFLKRCLAGDIDNA